MPVETLRADRKKKPTCEFAQYTVVCPENLRKRHCLKVF